VTWSERVDAVLAGDLAAALAYITPAGGAVVTAVSPFGLRDRDTGEVTFTTSLGLPRKLERIRREPKVALLFHTRDHGFARGDDLVLVQGTARAADAPDPRYLEEVLRPRMERFMGPTPTGPFWDRWLSAYTRERVPVHVAVERVTTWPSLDGSGESVVEGAPWPPGEPEAQAAPKKGTGPRKDAEKAARRAREVAHTLLAWRGADGFPVVAPVRVGEASADGIALSSAVPLPSGGRRAGLLAHDYGPKLTGLRVRQHTGWLKDGVYAPHTGTVFNAPKNKTLLLLVNGGVSRFGLWRARRTSA
jgi:Pyridoxamine 5'-phosphate oxidase